MTECNHFIANQLVPGSGGRSAPVYDPATGRERGRVALGSDNDVALAVAEAAKALPAWSAQTPLQRARVLFRFRELLEQHSEAIATLITAEHGKVLSDARAELKRGIEVVEFACGIPHLLKGEHSLNAGTGIDSYSLFQPVGVCVGITPFNFPAMVPLWMFPVALACGNTFVLKPSERDPSAPLLIAALLAEAGLPPGVMNVVNGDRSTVEALLAAPEVQAVSFVGSTPVAEAVYRQASARGIRAQALGGAKNHLVVLPDADPAQVCAALMGAAFGSAGERCMAISVAVCVGEQTADAVVAQLRAEIAGMRVGPGTAEPEPQMGPLVTREHADKVLAYIDQGVSEGATLVCDGRGFVCHGAEQGYFVGPTLFDHVQAQMRIYREEIFGPVLCIVRVPDLAAALALVNAHEYGNGSAVFTRDGAAARHFANAVHTGMVGINVPIPVPMAFHSFGGWKRSLFGPLHVHGPDGVRFYTRLKTVTARWPEAGPGQAEFTMPTLK
jgi:malonate-semialdehyde dehydrogenase (acetylating)/methylmalonate-semialdehyde dehydrogenase